MLLADETGKSLRQRLEGRLEKALEKGQTEKVEILTKQLETPPYPMALDYVVQAFFRIRNRVSNGGPITWGEIASYCSLTRFRFRPWELELIERLDRAYMRAVADREREEREARRKPGARDFKGVNSWKT